MIAVPAAGKTSRGIDVSHYDATVNWSQVRLALTNPADPGGAFAFLKASEGIKALDRTYLIFAAGCDAADMRHGAYHFYHPGQDPIVQAQFFVKTAGLNAHKYVADIETLDKDVANHVASNLQIFLDEVERLTGKIPMIYSGPYFLEALKLPASFVRYQLWIADYGSTKAPRIPAPFNSWVIWQTGENGTVAGVIGTKCDVDLFNGSAAAVRAFFT